MKTKILILIFALFSASVFAQKEETSPSNDIGLNINAMLNHLIFNKQSEDILEPRPEFSSLLTYRHFIHSKQAIRLSFGYSEASLKDTVSSIFGGGPVINDDIMKYFSLQFGMIERYFVRTKKVKAYVGLDWIFRHVHQKSNHFQAFFGGIFVDEVKITTTRKKNILGLGIPLGIQYIISDKFMISTEMSFEAINTFSKSKTQSEGQEDAEYRDNPEILGLNFRPPLALFIHFRF